jgi:hypothetical protein
VRARVRVGERASAVFAEGAGLCLDRFGDGLGDVSLGPGCLVCGESIAVAVRSGLPGVHRSGGLGRARVRFRGRRTGSRTTWSSGTYHRFYDACRVLPRAGEDPNDRTRARLWLTDASRLVLRNGLQLLGVSAPERM